MVETVGIDLPEAGETNVLRSLSGAERYYDQRYEHGYMLDEDWPIEKLRRIHALITELDLPRVGRVLDYGCGTGVFTAVLRKALPHWEVHGTDISTSALDLARMRLPDLHFHPLSDCRQIAEPFDLVFTHHVLEHVSDLSQTAGELAKLLAGSGTMVHVLPCGNPDSFVHRVCLLRKDGIQTNKESRFFCDEEGHLRRLTTDTLHQAWAGDFVIDRAYYANHCVGEINLLTQFDLRFVLDFAEPKAAVDAGAAATLRWLRVCLVLLWAVRKPVAVVRTKLLHGCNSIRDACLLGAALAAYPIAWPVDRMLRVLTAREWSRARCDPSATEMYVVLVRKKTA